MMIFIPAAIRVTFMMSVMFLTIFNAAELIHFCVQIFRFAFISLEQSSMLLALLKI